MELTTPTPNDIPKRILARWMFEHPEVTKVVIHRPKP